MMANTEPLRHEDEQLKFVIQIQGLWIIRFYCRVLPSKNKVVGNNCTHLSQLGSQHSFKFGQDIIQISCQDSFWAVIREIHKSSSSMGLDTRIGCVIQNNKKPRDYLCKSSDFRVACHCTCMHRHRREKNIQPRVCQGPYTCTTATARTTTIKNVFLFYFGISHLFETIQCVCRGIKNCACLKCSFHKGLVFTSDASTTTNTIILISP